MLFRILGFFGFLLPLIAGAPVGAAGVDPADQVFQLHVAWTDHHGVKLSWTIAPGHYLYRNRIVAVVNDRSARIDTKPGEFKDDPNFGLAEIYRESTEAVVALEGVSAVDRLIVTYQGCAEDTLCYPPISKSVDLSTLLVDDAPERASDPSLPMQVVEGQRKRAGAPNDTTTIGIRPESAALLGNSLFSTLAAFVGFGILLSLTPCVFPMIPIMSGMLARSGGDLSTGRSFVFSAAYVLAMAAAYGTLGIFAAWSGENLQAALQTPVAVVAMSTVFALLALSMFGICELQLPQSWTSRLAAKAGNRGSIGGAVALGFGSALIVGPCVTPPLAAALVFVAQTGQVMRGSLALFALGLGMGLPLVAFGVLGANVLPRSGPWLARVKHIFGFVFIALSIWMISRVASASLVFAAWGALVFAIGGYSIWSFLRSSCRRLPEFAAATVGILAVVCGGALIVGAGISADGLLRPFETVGLITHPANAGAHEDGFRIATSETSLEDAIRTGQMQGRAIMVDFSAEWCVECKLMERNVFSQEAVRQKLRGVFPVRADVTALDRESKNLMKRFAVVGPPTVVFLNADGTEVQEARVVGNVGVSDFLSKLEMVLR
ncbi:protein-disulfide reductase DsbD [Bradyrhizobium diazoefficiens]|nr:protein-disulfide reductase DsbD [Bradyrhizobium diazoefficiens]QQN62262.1 protein-disulfide reductase DsbD [Bradyrhizobium diazoefficiens]